MTPDGWRPNLQGTKQHLSLSGWTDFSTGIVAMCDKKGIYLLDGSVEGLPKCKNCAAREEKDKQ